MKDNITAQIKDLLRQSRKWIGLELEYLKLTASEKFTILAGTFVLGAICLMVAQIVVILLAFSLSDLFKMMMPPSLAYLSVSGVLILIILALFLLRRKLIFDPIAKFITRLFLDRK